MKWFKHDSDANQDAKLKRLRMKYGLEGYGLYWYCLELIANGVDESNINFELEHDAEIISFDTGIHYERVQEMMQYMVSLGLFENDAGVITCMKMAQRLDKSMTSSPAVRKMITGMRTESKDYAGYVYFILAESAADKKIKIGRSKNPWQRIKEIRSTDDAEGYDLSFIGKTKASDCVSLETGLHRAFDEIKLKNEWFEFDEAIVETATRMARDESYDYVDLLRHVVVRPDKIRLEQNRKEDSQPTGMTTKAASIWIMEQWNRVADETNANWQRVDDPEHTSDKRYRELGKAQTWIRKRLERQGKPNDWEAVQSWVNKYLLNLADDSFYAGHVKNDRYPNGCRWTVEQLFRNNLMVKAVEKITQEAA